MMLPFLQNYLFTFCKNLINVLSGINKHQLTCSILVGNFNANLSKWCPSDKDNKTGQDTDTFTIGSYTLHITLP